MNRFAKVFFVLCFMALFLSGQLLVAQTFTWETGTEVGDTVVETVGGIQVTVSIAPTGGGRYAQTIAAGGYAGTSGDIVMASVTNITSMTFTFSEAVDITSIYAAEVGGGNGGTWTYTPGSGPNSPVIDNINAAQGKTITLNWVGVSSFTVDKGADELSGFGFDNLVCSENSLPVCLTSFNAFVKNKGVTLEWTVESETNNMGFVLERCDKENDWMTVASYRTSKELKGRGTASTSKKYTFNDTDVDVRSSYIYRLLDVDVEGVATVQSTIEFTPGIVPTTTQLDAAYPNPFNPQTCISYQLAEPEFTEISVYDMLGRKVRTLVNGAQEAGAYHVFWNGKDNDGNSVSAGAYLIRLNTKKTTEVQKVLYIK